MLSLPFGFDLSDLAVPAVLTAMPGYLLPVNIAEAIPAGVRRYPAGPATLVLALVFVTTAGTAAAKVSRRVES